MRSVLILLICVIASLLILSCGGTQQTPPATVSVRLSATPLKINAGDQATLTWSSQGATSITIDRGIGSVAASGSVVVSPTATTVYTAVANGSGQTAASSATLTVNVPPGSIASVQHIIFMLQENRTFDNYFGQLNQYRAKQVMTAQRPFRPSTLGPCARKTKALPGMKNTLTRTNTTLGLRRPPWMALYMWLVRTPAILEGQTSKESGSWATTTTPTSLTTTSWPRNSRRPIVGLHQSCPTAWATAYSRSRARLLGTPTLSRRLSPV